MVTSDSGQTPSKSHRITKEDVERLLNLGELLRNALTDAELEQLEQLLNKQTHEYIIGKNGREMTKKNR